jgi:PAS domain S-box-containing protein
MAYGERLITNPAMPAIDDLRLHTLWGDAKTDLPVAPAFDGLLHALKTRFNVAAVMISIASQDNAVVNIRSGAEPSSLHCREALVACAAAGHGVFVVEDIAVPSSEPQPDGNVKETPVRFYAGAPLVISPGGQPVGALCLIGTRPQVFNPGDQRVLKSLAVAVSAMLVMPHKPAIAAAIALTAEKSALLINHDQAIEAINPRFQQLTGFAQADLTRTGVEELLCLDRPHSGALVLSHALLAEQPCVAMTRCHTHDGGTIPVEVFVFPLPDHRGRTAKTLLLMVPSCTGPIENFLLSLRSTERSELLLLHIAGLWAVDHQGRILKLYGAPIAHLEPSTHTDMLGKQLGDAGVFDSSQTNWTDFYQSLAADTLPSDVECCVTHNGQSQWYSMKGFRQTTVNGTAIGYHGSFRDITQSKLRELSLRKSEERLSLILKGTNDGV